jgi:suppressor for copper-sensitivity B
VSNNKVLLLDLTADWCITCQINKQTTLENEGLIEFLKSNNIFLMRGDWTKPNDKILNFIKKNGRLGIPLNIIYGPRNKNGILLPEILTKDLIIDNIMLVK